MGLDGSGTDTQTVASLSYLKKKRKKKQQKEVQKKKKKGNKKEVKVMFYLHTFDLEIRREGERA